ncbi:MAG: aldo/keto reductase [Erysipelotrichaceae bacterium]|nr:aldo/keto reductase [Erysipelotrichaceae bacterium]
MEYRTLSNGVKMPQLGYGTLQISNKDAESCVLDAIDCGYRLIDTASSYFNEEGIGNAIRKLHVPRSEFFITTKVWVQDSGYDYTLKAFNTSLEKLGLDYVDLYLIHQPYGDYYGSYKAMEELYKEGKVRAIGVCNFSAERFMDLYMNVDIKPMINQIELHPFFQQDSLVDVLDCYNCQVEAWGPLNEGQKDIFDNEVLRAIADKYHKTVSQVILRWHIQNGYIAIPKSTHYNRIKENMDIWDFTLDEDDFTQIKQLDIGYSEIIDYQCYTSAKWFNKLKIHE